MKGSILLGPISSSKVLPFLLYMLTLSLNLISIFLPEPCTFKHLNGYWVCFKLNLTMLYSIDLVTEHMDLLFEISEISLWQTSFGKLCGWNTVNDLDSKYWLSSIVIYSRASSQLSLSAGFLVLFSYCLWKVYLIVIKIWKKGDTTFCGASDSICFPPHELPFVQRAIIKAD